LGAAFLCQDAVTGEHAPDFTEQVGFGTMIDLGDQIDGAFVVDIFRPLPVVENEGSRRSRCITGRNEKLPSIAGHQ